MAISLDKFKKLLGIAAEVTDKDDVLSFALSVAEEIILNYCNINKIPQGLENTLYRIAADIYRNDSFGGSSGSGAVTKIKEGDTEVTFADSSSQTTASNALLKDYTAQLNRYRRLVW